MKPHKSYSLTAIAWKSVTRKLFRNLVLLLAVSILVALLVFAMLFNKAVEEDIEAATKRLGADIVIVPQEAVGNAEEFILESKEKIFYMDKSVYEAVREFPEIMEATYQIYLKTLGSECCSIEEGQVIAFDQDTDFVIRAWIENAPKLKKGEVLVGSYVYSYLGLINTAKLFGTGVNIVGHLGETDTGLDHGIFMRQEDLGQISKEAKGDIDSNQLSIIFLKIKPEYDVEAVAVKIQATNPTVGVMTRGSIGGGVRGTLKDIVKIFSITILISSLLSILLAWSTFTAMANERKREVGILRAIGAQRSHIIQLFLTEAAIISILGGIIGIVMGHYLINHLAGDFHLLTRLGAVTQLTMNNFLISGSALGLGVGVCMIGALIPVVRLANMEPLLAVKE
jgi:putative ABC transport system permease protein